MASPGLAVGNPQQAAAAPSAATPVIIEESLLFAFLCSFLELIQLDRVNFVSPRYSETDCRPFDIRSHSQLFN